MSASAINTFVAAYRARRIIWLASGFVLFVIVWAAFATLDEVIVGEGQVVPSSAVQHIQSLEGGILKRVLVEEGQTVKAGQELVELDDTHFRATFQGAEQELGALLARKARLEAELGSIDNQATLPLRAGLSAPGASESALAVEYAAYVARMRELSSNAARADQLINQQQQALAAAQRNTETLTQSLKLLDQEVASTESAVKSGALPQAELRKIERDRVRLKGELDNSKLEEAKLSAVRAQATSERYSLINQFRARAQSDLAEVQGKLASQQQSQPALADQLKRTRLTSPMHGSVKNIALRTVGGVVKPGELIMDIVPTNDKLVIEARVQPRDIAYVRPGLDAVVKFSAFDFVVYGGLKGRVINVSSDALHDDKGNPYYKLTVETDLHAIGGAAIIPGMQATVDVVSGKKSILSYWMKPLLRARANALRER